MVFDTLSNREQLLKIYRKYFDYYADNLVSRSQVVFNTKLRQEYIALLDLDLDLDMKDLNKNPKKTKFNTSNYNNNIAIWKQKMTHSEVVRHSLNGCYYYKEKYPNASNKNIIDYIFDYGQTLTKIQQCQNEIHPGLNPHDVKQSNRIAEILCSASNYLIL